MNVPARILLLEPEPEQASLAFITQIEPGQFLLNIQPNEGDDLVRFKLTRDQLFNINADSANILAGRKDA